MRDTASVDALWDDYDHWVKALAYEAVRSYDSTSRAVGKLAAETRQLLAAHGEHPSCVSDTAVILAAELPAAFRPASLRACRRERVGVDGLAATVAELRGHHRKLRPRAGTDRVIDRQLDDLLTVMTALGQQVTEPHPAWPGGWVLRLSRPGTPDLLLREAQRAESRAFRTQDDALAAGALVERDHAGLVCTPRWSPISGGRRPVPADAGAWSDGDTVLG
ncbi:hypothetical protein CU254_41645 (plasmid) [Amycolatopsis sp. AA4]|uniref:hypothetical protein n=1 Tax=Actinomycetes TaxID=1760 RepID=UPI0001B5517D|nr:MULTISPECIES: hypothetical protein [Actinomycetes]ATY17085.1 hypothetical protein CU254_41645 [Amycolatopsis sp. AA4]EFL12411.1 predicted protein [Streptomyces sp. AA4]